MEIETSVEGWIRRRQHRSGGYWFRAEMEIDWGSSAIPRGPEYGFAAAVREPLVRLQRPKFGFEMWDWGYFAWPHDRLDANLEMRDSDPEATLEADRKTSESFLNRSKLQLERYEVDQDTQEEHAATWPSKQLETNLDMRNSDLEAALQADRKASESILNWSTMQLEGYAIDQYTQEQNAVALPRNQLSVNYGMRDCTLETDQKVNTPLLKRREMDRDQHTQEQQKEPQLRPSLEADQKANTLQLKRREMDRDPYTQEQHKEPKLLDGKPVQRRSTRRRLGCAEAIGVQDFGRAMQRSWAC